MILLMHHLMGAAEIATMFNISRQRVQQLINRPDFPQPESELAMGKIWRTDDIRAWGITTGRLKAEGDAA